MTWSTTRELTRSGALRLPRAARMGTIAGLCAVLAAALSATAAEPTPEADFAAANDRMLSGDTAGALALYQHLESRGVAAADLAYNTGVALAASDRPLEALIAWERALRLDPSHADARANLAVARKRLPARAAPSDDATSASLVEALEPAVAPIPRDAAAFALALMVTLASAVATIRRLGIIRGPVSGSVVIVALVGAALAAAVVGAHEAVARDGRAVVRTARQLKDGAEERFKDIAPVAAGERVRVMREEAGWVEVLAPDGVSGWVPANAVLRL